MSDHNNKEIGAPDYLLSAFDVMDIIIQSHPDRIK